MTSNLCGSFNAVAICYDKLEWWLTCWYVYENTLWFNMLLCIALWMRYISKCQHNQSVRVQEDPIYFAFIHIHLYDISKIWISIDECQICDRINGLLSITNKWKVSDVRVFGNDFFAAFAVYFIFLVVLFVYIRYESDWVVSTLTFVNEI